MLRAITVLLAFEDAFPEEPDFEDEIDGAGEATEHAIHHRRHQVELEQVGGCGNILKRDEGDEDWDDG